MLQTYTTSSVYLKQAMFRFLLAAQYRMDCDSSTYRTKRLLALAFEGLRLLTKPGRSGPIGSGGARRKSKNHLTGFAAAGQTLWGARLQLFGVLAAKRRTWRVIGNTHCSNLRQRNPRYDSFCNRVALESLADAERRTAVHGFSEGRLY